MRRLILSFNEVTEYKHILECAKKVCNGGRWKAGTQMFEMNILQWTADIKRKLDNDEYEFKPTNNFTIKERGKTRDIKAHHISDRAVMKAYSKYELCPAVEGLIMNNNSASQKGKGTDHAIIIFREALAHAYKKFGTDFCVGTYDFHDYFGSIPHDKAIEKIGSRLSHEGKELFEKYSKLFEVGYGIGGEISQITSIAYPSSIDREIACQPFVIASGRYMDDGWFITETKEEAQKVHAIIDKKSKEHGLTINEKRTGISRMKYESVTFLKKRTKITKSGQIVMKLTRKNIRNRKRAIEKQKNDNIPMLSIVQSAQSWFSYARKYRSDKAKMDLAKKFSNKHKIGWDNTKIIMRGGIPNGLKQGTKDAIGKNF